MMQAIEVEKRRSELVLSVRKVDVAAQQQSKGDDASLAKS
jgi:hypothetical protein